jgi:hypothetical protein
MKRVFFYTVFAVSALIIFTACAARKTAAEQKAIAIEIRNAVEMSEFRFIATHAHPMAFRSIALSTPFDVRVSPDTVQANLPFFGRAFRAPMNLREGGYYFTSTDFEYSVRSGRRAGNWLVQIDFRDVRNGVTFNFDIWENGTASLSVVDIDRQSISFQGNIEMGE